MSLILVDMSNVALHALQSASSGKMNYFKAFFIGLQSNWKAKKNMEYSSHIYIIKNN